MQPRFNSLHISKRALQAHFAGLRKDRDSERVISRIGRQQLTATAHESISNTVLYPIFHPKMTRDGRETPWWLPILWSQLLLVVAAMVA